MDKRWKLQKKICILVMLLLCISVFPLCLIRKNKNIDPNLGAQYAVSDQNGLKLKQEFLAQTSYLAELAFDITFPNGKPEEGYIKFSLTDSEGKVIQTKDIHVDEISDYEFSYVSIDKWIEGGGGTLIF